MTGRQLKHSQNDRGLDLYQTDPVAVESLIRYEKLPLRIWDGSCGPGNILRVLRMHGHEVFGSDLADYKSPFQDLAGVDYLQLTEAPWKVDATVQNPPFYVKDEFVEKSLELVELGYFLLPLTWLESDSREKLFSYGMLERVLVFRQRLPMMHREGWDGEISTSTTAFAWYVFNRSYRGFPEIRWINVWPAL